MKLDVTNWFLAIPCLYIQDIVISFSNISIWFVNYNYIFFVYCVIGAWKYLLVVMMFKVEKRYNHVSKTISLVILRVLRLMVCFYNLLVRQIKAIIYNNEIVYVCNIVLRDLTINKSFYNIQEKIVYLIR